jgi:hypothetical protein
MAISSLFFEISRDWLKLNLELQKAIATAKDARVQISQNLTKAQSIIDGVQVDLDKVANAEGEGLDGNP